MTSEISVNSYLPDPEPENADALVRKVDKNIFVQATRTSYDREDLKDDTLWEQFREDSTFDPCLLHTSQTESTESTNYFGVVGLQTDDTLILADDDFKSGVLNIRLRRLRNALRKRGVWVLKDAKVTIAKSLIRTLEKEHLTP
jgi:hypothetical protein